MKDIAKPIILTSVQNNGHRAYTQWLKEAIRSFAYFPEINGMVLQAGAGTKVFGQEGFTTVVNKGTAINAGLADALSLLPELANFKIAVPAPDEVAGATLHGRQLQGNQGDFKIMVEGKPFYIKGVAYNPEQSWRDGYHPLNRKKLDTDFEAIKAMGANTIRRYAPSAYDRNILAAAGRHGLKVMYGFWFDPKVDFARDKAKVAAYIRKVEQTVARHKNDSVILAWNIGNESSGLLKHHFAQPYLTVVRRAYMEMIETMARRVHQLDAERPVLTSVEHARQLPGEIYAFTAYAPSVDILAVNSYYKEWISEVHRLAHQFRPQKPYMISEFGPKGYWENQLNDMDQQGQLQEESDKHKAMLYAREWQEDVLAHKGCNVGGVAFCWQDRYEGTATWFGLTDFKGRKKEAYYALRQQWKGGSGEALTDLFINGPYFSIKPGGTYEFTAVSPNKELKDFEWQLLSGDYLEATGKIEKKWTGKKVKVTFPKKGGHFRLYVYAVNGKKGVITASKPISLYDGIFNEGI